MTDNSLCLETCCNWGLTSWKSRDRRSCWPEVYFLRGIPRATIQAGVFRVYMIFFKNGRLCLVYLISYLFSYKKTHSEMPFHGGFYAVSKFLKWFMIFLGWGTQIINSVVSIFEFQKSCSSWMQYPSPSNFKLFFICRETCRKRFQRGLKNLGTLSKNYKRISKNQLCAWERDRRRRKHWHKTVKQGDE